MYISFSSAQTHFYVRYLKEMVSFFLAWKSLNISFDEPIPPSFNSYGSFFFLNMYTVLAAPKTTYTLTTDHIYV